MKLLTKLDNYLEIHSLLSEAIDEHEVVVSWQKSESDRSIRITELLELDDIKDQLVFKQSPSETLNQTETYFFFKDQKIIFKSSLSDSSENSFLIDFPAELKNLEETEVKELDINGYLDQNVFFVAGAGRANDPGLMSADLSADKMSTKWTMNSMSSKDSELFAQELSFVTLDEEDRIYADKREAPRARPPEGKTVGVIKKDHPETVLDFPLFDLSQGGLGFLIEDKDLYQVGDHLLVTQFGSKAFDQPMEVEIKAIRDTDQSATTFKVGCAFLAD